MYGIFLWKPKQCNETKKDEKHTNVFKKSKAKQISLTHMRISLTWDFSYTASAIRRQGGDICKVQSTEPCAQRNCHLNSSGCCFILHYLWKLFETRFHHRGVIPKIKEESGFRKMTQTNETQQ